MTNCQGIKKPAEGMQLLVDSDNHLNREVLRSYPMRRER